VHEGPVVVFSGGGTGGHLYPALAIADALRARRPDVRVVFVGARRGIESTVLPQRGEEHHLLPLQGVDRSRPLQAWRAFAGLAASLVRVARLFRRLRPEAVVVTGGYAGAAAGIAAGMRGIPLVLQEQNSVPGVVTRALTRWASEVHVAFPDAAVRLPRGERVRLTGNPVRPVSARPRAEARRFFGISEAAVLVLVVGGSQGSAALNRAVLAMARDVTSGRLRRLAGVELLWATGRLHHEKVVSELGGPDAPTWIRTLPFIEDMPAALSAADLAVGRAGAMFTAELLNQGLPSVLVPLPTAAADHQTHNARALAASGAATVLPEAELSGESLHAAIAALTTSGATLQAMREAALRRARPHAAAELAAAVDALLPTRGRTAS
jgi:UDP-N-acetylglucosamine--N-acetylmuramyl-(pentapeptide) pyrophosphoryl-undecaprenol N-acetylglucosamine transferase